MLKQAGNFILRVDSEALQSGQLRKIHVYLNFGRLKSLEVGVVTIDYDATAHDSSLVKFVCLHVFH